MTILQPGITLQLSLWRCWWYRCHQTSLMTCGIHGHIQTHAYSSFTVLISTHSTYKYTRTHWLTASTLKDMQTTHTQTKHSVNICLSICQYLIHWLRKMTFLRFWKTIWHKRLTVNACISVCACVCVPLHYAHQLAFVLCAFKYALRMCVCVFVRKNTFNFLF